MLERDLVVRSISAMQLHLQRIWVNDISRSEFYRQHFYTDLLVDGTL